MKNVFKKILPFLFIFLLGGIFLGFKFFEKNKSQTLPQYEVKRCTITRKVTATGSLKPAKEISLASEISGKVKKIYFKEGEKVKKGETIIKIEDKEILTKILEAKSALKEAKENLKKIKKGIRKEEKEFYLAKIENAKKEVEAKEKEFENVKKVAQIQLENLYQQVEPLVLEAFSSASDAIIRKLDPLFKNDQSNPELTFQTKNFSKENELLWKRKILTQVLEDWKKEIDFALENKNSSNLENLLKSSQDYLKEIKEIFPLAREVVEASIDLPTSEVSSYKELIGLGEKEVLDSLERITLKENEIELQKANNEKMIEAASSQLDLAKEKLKLAQKEYLLKAAPAEEEIVRQAEAQVEKIEAELSYYYLQLEKTEIKAPLDGVINEIYPEVGDFVNVGEKLVSFVLPEISEIEVEIPEAEIVEIKPNQEVIIDFDALPGKIFKGKVLSINPSAKVISGVVYYETKILLLEKDPALKPKMTANVEIIVQRKENALCLPYYFLKTSDGKKFVYLKTKDGILKKEIKIGLEGENYVEVLEGLKEGDLITFPQD